MTQLAPIPPPVQDFFAGFAANPDAKGLRAFRIALLDLEVRRAKFTVVADPLLPDPSGWYRADIVAAQRAQRLTRRDRALDPERFDLRHHWLTLLGWRLALERGLAMGGVPALRQIATERLDVPLKEAKAWDEETLFRHYTTTVLRDEWDYDGTDFRDLSPAHMEHEQRGG